MRMIVDTVNQLTRPAVVILFVLGILWGFYVGKIEGPAFLALAGTALTWLFAERAITKAHEAGVQAALTIPPGAQPIPNPPTGG